MADAPRLSCSMMSLQRAKGEQRGTHRRTKGKYKTRIRMPSELDPYLVTIEGWLAAEPQLTALAIVGRLAQRDADQFGPKQHSIVQRLLKALRRKAAERLIATTTTDAGEIRKSDSVVARLRSGCALPPFSTTGKSRQDPHSISARRTTAPVTFLREAIRGVKIQRRLTVRSSRSSHGGRSCCGCAARRSKSACATGQSRWRLRADQFVTSGCRDRSNDAKKDGGLRRLHLKYWGRRPALSRWPNRQRDRGPRLAGGKLRQEVRASAHAGDMG